MPPAPSAPAAPGAGKPEASPSARHVSWPPACRGRGQESCGACGGVCALKAPLLAEFNDLGIPELAEVTDLNALAGSFINLPYPLPNGETVKLLEDGKIYLGAQVEKRDSGRCYGLAGDGTFLLVCEYGEGGSDPELILYKKRK